MDLKMILENAADELSRAHEYIREDLREKHADESDESWLLLDDIEKSLENLYELHDKIHFAMCFASYAGACESASFRGGAEYDFGFGSDSWDMRNLYLDWADEVDVKWARENSLYEELEGVFFDKVKEFEVGYEGDEYEECEEC